MMDSTAVWFMPDRWLSSMRRTDMVRFPAASVVMPAMTSPMSFRSSAETASIRSMPAERGSTPLSSSSAARRCMRGVPQRKLPVSVTRPAYRQYAISGLSSTPR